MASVVFPDPKAAGHIAGPSPRSKARIAGVFYFITIVTSIYFFFPVAELHWVTLPVCWRVQLISS